MGDIETRADSLRFYLTGAGSDGGAQADPALSLGGYRSSSEIQYHSITALGTMADITLDHISGHNPPGVGTITATGTDELTWTPPGGLQGDPVTILNGETKVLEGGGRPGAFVRVSRTSATALSGTMTVTFEERYGNVIGFDDVSDTEAASATNKYHAIAIMNESAITINSIYVYLRKQGKDQVSDGGQLGASDAGTITTTGNFNDWPASGFCRIEESDQTLREVVYYSSRTSIALTIPAAGRELLGTTAAAGAADDNLYPIPGIGLSSETFVADALQTIADEDTAPTGIPTWITGVRPSDGLSIGSLTTGAKYGIWLYRETVAGTTQLASVENAITTAFSTV